MDNTTLDEVTTMITDFNPNFTNFYPTLAVVITLILEDDWVVKKIILGDNINLHIHELYYVYYKFSDVQV